MFKTACILLSFMCIITACSGRDRSRDNAIFPPLDISPIEKEAYFVALRSAVPEIDERVNRIEKNSGGKYTAAFAFLTNPYEEYNTIRFCESRPDAIITIWSFRINKKTGEVLCLDPVKNAWVTLEEWRKSRHRSR